MDIIRPAREEIREMNVPQLAVRGRLVRPEGVARGTILISEGRIAGFASASANVRADAVYDYGDSLVLSGAIDTHVHFREPGFTQKEDFASGTMAAAAGGVTTVVDMPNTEPWVTSASIFREKRRTIERKACVDFGLSGGLTSEGHLRVEELTAAGALSVETFLADAPEETVLDDDYRISKSLVECAHLRQVMGVYCDSQSFWSQAAKNSRARGEVTMSAFHAAKPSQSESLGAARMCILNKDAEATLVLRQISTASALNQARFHRRQNPSIHVETTPHYLLLSSKNESNSGFSLKISPPLRSERDRLALWRGIDDGTVEIISSDHSPHTLLEKERDDVWGVPSGFPSIETSLVLMLDQVKRGRLSIRRMSELMSKNPAKVLGLSPRKGTLTTGAQADLVVADFAEHTIRAERLHSKCGWTPYEGRKVRARLRCTFLAGRMICRDGEILESRSGRFVSRTIPRGARHVTKTNRANDSA